MSIVVNFCLNLSGAKEVNPTGDVTQNKRDSSEDDEDLDKSSSSPVKVQVNVSLLWVCSHIQTRTRIPTGHGFLYYTGQLGSESESKSVQCEISTQYNCSDRETPLSRSLSPVCEPAIMGCALSSV